MDRVIATAAHEFDPAANAAEQGEYESQPARLRPGGLQAPEQ